MEAEIDDRWLDIDFSKQPEYVFGDTGPRVDLFASTYEDSVPVLSDSEIMASIEREEAEGGGADRLVTRIYDQKQEGSCVANACAQANEMIQAKQFGKKRVIKLSAMSLYKRIGRSPGSGANVGDGVREMCTRGILPLDTPENRVLYGDAVMENTGFYEKFPDNWEATALLLAGLEYYTVKTLQGLKTALVRHEPVIVGRQGHSITYARLMRRGNSLVVKYPNSWHERWGDKGFGYDSLSQMSQSAQYAYVLRSVKTRKQA